MFRRIISTIKGWIFALPARPRMQNADDPIEKEIMVGENFPFEDKESGAPMAPDKASADEIVATWNLLNPP